MKLLSDSRMIRKIAAGPCGSQRRSAFLEFIRELPATCTEPNIAAMLVDEVGKAAPLSEVQSAVKRLNNAQFIRNTEEGWKLQTAQEKNWETERRGHLETGSSRRTE